MAKLIIMRGLPASGKTTFAKQWVAEDPANRARVNRDDLRKMLNGSYFEKGVTEQRVIKIRDGSIGGLLAAGVDVVSDDTNLPNRAVKDLMKVAAKAKAEVEVRDLTNVSREECIRRDRLRSDSVGVSVIMDMFQRFLAGKRYPLPVPELPTDASWEPRPYTPPLYSTPAIMVDLDGTLCLLGDRNPYDASACLDDRPNSPVLDLVWTYYDLGYEIIFMSGRDSKYRDPTEEWLARWAPPEYRLYMRPEGDRRPDYVVKTELFDKHVRDEWNVFFVLDDRNSVVQNWRKMGLTVFQVADGDF